MAKADLIASLRAQIDSIESNAAGSRQCAEPADARGVGDEERRFAAKGSHVPGTDGGPSTDGRRGPHREPIENGNASAAHAPEDTHGNRVPRSREASSDDSATDAFRKIVALVNVSDRSEKTIRERLAKAEFPPAAIEEAVSRAKDYQFIDDARFASVLIRSRLAQGKGAAGIERELAGHDIDIASCPGWPYEYGVDESTELDRALHVLDRKPPRSKNVRDGAYRRLVQKGFSSSVAASAARIWTERRE